MATVCQPKSAYNLSFMAQATDPQEENIKQLNKRIQWQINNAIKGLIFVPLDINSFSVLVFIDVSFTNNRDLLLQINFIIVLIDHNQNANILYWSLIKCK